MTNEEIQEAARLLSSLPALRASVAELDFDDREFRDRRLTIELKIQHRKTRSGFQDNLLTYPHVCDEEILAAVLRIVRRRRAENLRANLRRLAQLGVTP